MEVQKTKSLAENPVFDEDDIDFEKQPINELVKEIESIKEPKKVI